ncbi:MAG: phenylalanine--tRNA ligase subunit beta [Candidatus Peribacteraceae bacterium]|jgi:phenylalanyl-tRNA synthetase beta chain
MKISLSWLKDFITLTETDPQAIAQTVTERIAEVDEVEEMGALLRDVVVGQVLTLAKHPNADKLTLADVRTDRGVKKVVCGGTNLRKGMRVAFAHVGARVRWHGTEMATLEKAKVRGEESEGMICSAEELDLAARFPQETERTIIDLGDGEEDVGKPLKEYLDQDDAVLHIDNHAITHRADLFSHVGMAREFVAAGLAEWKKEPSLPSLAFPQTPFPFSITAEQKKLVPRYHAVMLEIPGLGQTPAWMKRRLEATGWRSINLPIDITNYVMMETGMPLHSFDAADIKGDVRMRRAKKGEKIRTLDGEERELSKGALVMEDAEGIFDLLGIMGGLRGSTKEATRKIWLHSAVVDPVNTRQTVIAMGHRTDAATVYEKGVPPVAAEFGLLRAAQLFLELIPGARLASAPLAWGDERREAKPITLRLARVENVLGTSVPASRATKALTDLGFSVEEKGKTLKVTPPPWRLGDIRGEHDLMEEVGRIVGYDAIEPVMPAAVLTPPPRDHRLHALRDALKEAGCIETRPLSLVGGALLRKAGMDPGEAVVIRNPLGEETSLLHTGTLPSLLEHAQRNILAAGTLLRTFTFSRVFTRTTDAGHNREGAKEHSELSVLFADLEGKGNADLKSDPFLLLKRELSLALSAPGFKAEWKRDDAPAPWMHPGRSALLSVDGETVGRLFEVHPRIRKNFDLPHRAAAAVVDLARLLSLKGKTVVPLPLPAFPAVTYDVTVTRMQEQRTETLLAKLRGASPLLEKVEVVDLFSGKGLEERQFNLTLRFTYRTADRTLTEEEAQKAHAAVTAVLTAASNQSS